MVDVGESPWLDGTPLLAGIRDHFDRGLPGWARGDPQGTGLVVSAPAMALSRRRPELPSHPPGEPSIFTSLEFANRIADRRVSASFGSTGDAYDCEHDRRVIHLTPDPCLRRARVPWR